MPKGVPIDLTGERFGSWTVVGRAGARRYTTQTQVLWLCRCGCGNESAVSTGNLRQGRSTGCRTCGARRREERKMTDVSRKEGRGDGFH